MAQPGVAQHQKTSMQPMRSQSPQRTNDGKNKSGYSGQFGSGRQKKGAKPASLSAGKKTSLKNSYAGRPAVDGKSFSPVKYSNGYSTGKGRTSIGIAPRNGENHAHSMSKKPSRSSSAKSAPLRKAPVKSPPSLQAERERRRQQIKKIRRRERINRLMICITGYLVLCALFVYIGRMADVAAASKSINQLESAIDKLKEEKQYKEYELAAAQNMERVEDEALGRLGMIVPSEDQIRYIPMSGYFE